MGTDRATVTRTDPLRAKRRAQGIPRHGYFEVHAAEASPRDSATSRASPRPLQIGAPEPSSHREDEALPGSQ